MKMTKLASLAFAALCLTQGVHADDASQRPVVTVRWMSDASPDTPAQSGRVTVPVVDPAGDCMPKFRVIGITTWIVRQKDRNDIVNVRSQMLVSVRKLFEGKLPLPELKIIRSVDDLDLAAVVSFKGSHAAESDSWIAANAEFTERFEDVDAGPPPSWERIELRCTN